MVEYSSPRNPSQRLDAVFGALADCTRRNMLRNLARGESCVSALAAPFDMSLAAASKHIKVLEAAGLVRRTVEGRVHRVRLEARPLHAGLEWLRHYERFWNARLDALEAVLRAQEPVPARRRSARASATPATKGRGSKPRPPQRKQP